MTEITINNTQKVGLNISALDKNGQPVAITGFEWRVNSGDGTFDQAFLISGNSVIQTSYTVKLTADFGNGVQTVEETVIMNVTDPVTSLPVGASVTITPATPQPK